MARTVRERGDRVRFWAWLQWLVDRQLAEARADDAVLADLAVGFSDDGFDAWEWQDLVAPGVRIGAPPDPLGRDGQDWGLPPFIPWRLAAEAYRPFAATARAAFRHARGVRIDHVMGLHRLWWVPDGLDPTEGAYVSYPTEEMFATVAVEAHLSGCVVVGEDLGTVPVEVSEAMAGSAMLGTWVAQFSQGDAVGQRLDRPGHEVVAMVGTHDTPTWASWLRAGDVDLHRDLDLVDESWAASERARRSRQVSNLADTLVEAGFLDPGSAELAGSDEATRDGHTAVARFMGDSDAAVVLVSLDDLEGEREPQNVPGTPSDRPNWVLRLDRPLGDLEHDEDLRSRLLAIQHSRLGSWGRTQH